MRIMPIKEGCSSVEFIWSIDAGLNHLYDYKPLELLSHLLGHEGGGSLLFYLKRQQWANDLSSGMKLSASSFASFTVSVDLTPSARGRRCDTRFHQPMHRHMPSPQPNHDGGIIDPHCISDQRVKQNCHGMISLQTDDGDDDDDDGGAGGW